MAWDETRRVIREPPISALKREREGGILFTQEWLHSPARGGGGARVTETKRERERERERERGRDTRPSRGGIRSWTSRLKGGTKMAVRGEARVRNATPLHPVSIPW